MVVLIPPNPPSIHIINGVDDVGMAEGASVGSSVGASVDNGSSDGASVSDKMTLFVTISFPLPVKTNSNKTTIVTAIVINVEIIRLESLKILARDSIYSTFNNKDAAVF